VSGREGKSGRAGSGPAVMLRTRLFLNLAPFLLILLAVGFYAATLFPGITTDAYSTVASDYRSVRAAQQMELALTRMQEGLLYAMQGNRDIGAAVYETNRISFENNLKLQLDNGKTPKEKDLNTRLRNNYVAISRAGASILSLTDPIEQSKAFKLSIEPAMPAAEYILDQIRDLNEQAILQMPKNVSTITWNVTRSMAIGMGVALLFAFYACYKLIRSILEPIRSLTHATQDLGEGKMDQLLPVTSRDELGDLADSFNKMAARLRVYQQSTAEKIVRLHRTLEATITSFPDPIFVLNRDGDVDLQNRAATELADALELKDALPHPLQELASAALTGGKSFLPHSFKDVVSFRLEDGEKFYLPRVQAMRNEENVLIGVAVILYDVTRFRLLDDAKTNLVATVSHELKTPLTSVRMAVHLLLEKTMGTLTPRQHELLVTARNDSERLLRILNDLLDLTRLEEGKSDLYREKMSPAELVQAVADIMRDTVANRKLKFTCQVEPNLPPVFVDSARINHVFTNLIGNAIKYSPVGGEIILQAGLTPEREVEFSVLDQGPGVGEEHKDRIFDRFYRVPGTPKKGAGLGLSIAREIVLAHDGRIGIRNRPGGGSDFYFVLGAADSEVPASNNGQG
jgi:two-component system, NtrC family, sensor histidine kinase KinB